MSQETSAMDVEMGNIFQQFAQGDGQHIITFPRFELVNLEWALGPEIIETAEKEPLHLESSKLIAGNSVGSTLEFVLVFRTAEEDRNGFTFDLKLEKIDDIMIKPSVHFQAKVMSGIGEIIQKQCGALPLSELKPNDTVSLVNFINIDELKQNMRNKPADCGHVLKLTVELKVYELPKTSFQLDPSSDQMALIHVGEYFCEVSKEALSESSPMLAVMLSENKSGISPKEITFDGFPAAYFPHLRSYLEKGEFPPTEYLDMDELEAFLKLSTEYEIRGLYEKCNSALAVLALAFESTLEEIEELIKKFGSTMELREAVNKLKELGNSDEENEEDDSDKENEDEEDEDEDEEEEDVDDIVYSDDEDEDEENEEDEWESEE